MVKDFIGRLYGMNKMLNSKGIRSVSIGGPAKKCATCISNILFVYDNGHERTTNIILTMDPMTKRTTQTFASYPPCLVSVSVYMSN